MNGTGITPHNMTKGRRAILAEAKTAGDVKKLKELFQKQEEDRAKSSKGDEKGFM